ncbi:MAG: pilus assembly protein, partial [Chloroflexi bacterium]|nr:pilus assembly protein [Chloroflexota bacterium]
RAQGATLLFKPPLGPGSGQALVEFALVITLLFFIVMGVFDLGRAVYAYNVTASAAREGAHYGILNPTDTTGIETQARANTIAMDPSQITVTVQCSPCTVNNNLSVTVTYRFVPVTLFFGSFTVTGKSTMTIE